MLRAAAVFALGLGFLPGANAQPSFKTPISYEEADQRAGDLLGRMRLDEKLLLVSGHRSFFIRGFPQHGIPELHMSDPSGGVNIRRNVGNTLEKSTAFPAPIALAATWNVGLAHQYGKSIGEECRAGGIAILLGPGVNIYRHSQNGRNFEYFGEDPFLAARLAERYVTGVLETGTIPTLKHFVANNTEYYRRTSNSVVDERTLHEIYLPAFKAGIDAGAMAVMTAYNQLNGEWCGQSDYVISRLLRQELGFKWLVMSDWWSVWDAEKIIKSGLDLEMPGEKYIQSDADRLLRSGKITEAQIDRMARSILRTCIAMGLYDRPVRDAYHRSRRDQHAEVALQTARESIVLLRNNGLLPLALQGEGKILLTGKFLSSVPQGGGSAEVVGYNTVPLAEALRALFGERLEISPHATEEQLGGAAVVIASTGTWDSEGWDRPFALPVAEEEAVARAVRANPNTIVVINSGGGINMSGWVDKAAAILHAWYPGQTGNRAVAEILGGVVNPSGRLPFTVEQRFEDSPGANYLPKGERLYAGWDQDNDMSRPVYDIRYQEGILVGYRWYETRRIKSLFAFGHGLSYSTFKYSDLRLVPGTLRRNGRVSVEFAVTNTSKRGGADVPQVYVRALNPRVPRPEKELKGFSKLTLGPGESAVVRVRLREKDFAYWDTETHGWRTDPGEYEIVIGPASDQPVLLGKVVVEQSL